MERHTGQNQSAAHAKAAAPAAAAPARRTAGSGGHGMHPLDTPSAAAKILIVSLILVSLVVSGSILAGLLSGLNREQLTKDDQYQAVFLDNGQVYFGKLSDVDDSYVRVTDIYYLQVEQQIQPDQDAEGEEAVPQQPQQQISLAKLGNELHGPEDEMFVNRDKIVFWENLKTDGQVTQAITEFQTNGGNDSGEDGN